MKRTQLLAAALVSFFTISCEQSEVAAPSVSQSIAGEVSQQQQSVISSVETYRKNLLVEERFETPELADFISGNYSAFYKMQSSRLYSFDASAEKAKKGTRSGKFEMLKADAAAGVIRSEAASRNAETNRHRWYGLSLYLPSSDWSTSNDWEIITQFWSQHDAGEEAHNPPIELFVSKGRLKLGVKWASAPIHTDATRDGELKFDLGLLPKDKWADFVYHINYSYKEDGLIQVWMDGKLVVNHKGPNSYNDQKIPFFKYGIYKRNWDTATTKRRLFVDEVRVGNENATYNDVAPTRKL
ncbi:polysaccharide lyase [Pontibacter arcticus]|uniref:Polysaccharide lyase n=1 Tax=Pontibacter arcticus TaxID=2080288 RepID=A0A364RGM7_9BACT|nr:polysaccharide lyase [Pontibacter arcticus]RAU82009.1 hypothetical protein DP923_15130 [Pontibacter arcticus]RAU82622.1 hypothetical protein DP923_12735 [Pontibacter arcticus]RAU82681.1 hypothetical protein DP923_05325 [Pontibacter arcticus]RAU83433.1 hypothetical protein DP923_09545 [Pontibacter arcticus]